jgi:hypothetical protein
MSAEAVNAASMAFKKALIERALGAELSHHLKALGMTLGLAGRQVSGGAIAGASARLRPRIQPVDATH